MTYTFNGNQYHAQLEDDEIHLTSLHETVIFPKAGKELREDAEREFFSVPYAGERLSSFISNYIDDHLQYYIDTHKEEAVILTNDLN